MPSFSDWRLRSQLLFTTLAVIILLSGTLTGYNAFTTLRDSRQEIAEDRENTLQVQKDKLWDYVNLAYETVKSHYRSAQDPDWLEGRYGPDLVNVVDLAESIVKGYLEKEYSGRLSPAKARYDAVEALRVLRFNDGDEYIWISDITAPVPNLIMNPGYPEKEGLPLSDTTYNVIGTEDADFDVKGGGGMNLYTAALDVISENGSGFLSYDWPRKEADGYIRNRPRLSHVRLIPEWGWIIGTGMFTDIAMDEAKKLSMETIHDMKFDNREGYFWINDMTMPYPRMIMDAASPELNGRILDDPDFNIVGEKGSNLFVEMVKITEVGGSAYLRYPWPKPAGSKMGETETKEAFVRPFEPWNWIIGSGIYINKIERDSAAREEEMFNSVVRSILVFVGITIAAVLVSLVIISILIRKITRPINEVVNWSTRLAEGDLTERLTYTGRNEIGRQGENLNRAAESIRSLMIRIKELTDSAEDVKDQLESSTEETGSALSQITVHLDNVQTKFTDMDGNIDESSSAVEQISANIRGLESRINQQAAAVEESSAAVEEILGSLNNIARTSEEKSRSAGGLKGILEDCRGRFGAMNESIEKLSKAGDEMGTMAAVIGGIASRTNLLSMNAAIEAAHAGDSGKGFAVVAEEMRGLAENASSNARNIKKTLDGDVREIEILLGESRQVNEIYFTMEEEAASMADVLSEISGTMVEMSAGSREILESVESLRTISSEVLTGSKEMSSGNEVVSRTINEVADVSREVALAISEVKLGNEKINRSVLELDANVRRMVESISSISREVGRFRT